MICQGASYDVRDLLQAFCDYGYHPPLPPTPRELKPPPAYLRGARRCPRRVRHPRVAFRRFTHDEIHECDDVGAACSNAIVMFARLICSAYLQQQEEVLFPPYPKHHRACAV